jgi:cellulose synthase/poly-beta-1,6-N-acetylglucosamine synthase-like glycosyltransferase
MHLVDRLDTVLLEERKQIDHSASLSIKKQRQSSVPQWVLKLRHLSPAIKKRITMGAILAGIPAVVFYYAWWPLHGGSILSAPVFFVSIVYSFVQVFSAWYIYAKIKLPPPRTAPPGLSVDVFVPVYDEDFALVEESLKAAKAITYPHRTFLLDDARRDDFRALAEQLGVTYIRRNHNGHAKAGNVNHGLQHSTADFVTIFDVDHIPAPHFLDSVLGHFDDPAVGFVQAFVAHGNQAESFIARATAGQSYDVFSATSMGMYGCGAATVWGAHCTFRRSALDSIGGHQVGLAEDLHTSLVLHAKGWQSVYVPEVVARGLVPADLRAYFIQHLKWSHGVFQILFEKSLPLLRRLRPSQVTCYLTRMTYYLIGPVAFLQMLALAAGLFLASPWIQNKMASFLIHLTPAFLGILAIRVLISILWERDPAARLVNLDSGSLTAGTWPIYTLSLVNVLLHIRRPHIATPKKAQGGHYLRLVIPQIVMVALLSAGIIRRLAMTHVWDRDLLIIVAFAFMMIAWHGAVFYGVWEGWRMHRRQSNNRPKKTIPSLVTEE